MICSLSTFGFKDKHFVQKVLSCPTSFYFIFRIPIYYVDMCIFSNTILDHSFCFYDCLVPINVGTVLILVVFCAIFEFTKQGLYSKRFLEFCLELHLSLRKILF